MAWEKPNSLTPMSENDATTKGIRLVGKNLLFGSVAVIFFFLVLEIAARVVGFDEPVRFQVLAKGKSERFENSDLLGWEPIKVSGDFNEDGFIGPRVPKERTPGVLRIAALGDSCTQWGDPPYPELLRARLETSVGATEALNAGVAGYSSTQGRIHFQHDVLPYRPDIVTIYFGWNDHWTKNAHTDSEIFDPARNAPWKKASAQRLAEIRVIQIGFFLKELVVGNRWPLVLRVPLREYRKNLNEMVEQVREFRSSPLAGGSLFYFLDLIQRQ